MALLRTSSARAALREMMNPAGSWFVGEARVNGGADAGDLSGLLPRTPRGHERIGSDWVLAEALAASPTRFNFPVSRSEGHDPLVDVGTGLTGHHALVPPAEVYPERRGGWRSRRKAQNLKPVGSNLASEGGPTTAPAKQTEWLGPVRPSLLEPRFSSGRALKDVFRAAEVSKGIFELPSAHETVLTVLVPVCV